MQSLDIEANDEEKQEKLAGDFSTPFSPPSDTKDRIPKDDPALDTGDDEHEWYDEGREGVAEKSDLGDKGIKGYRPKHYQAPTHGPVKTVKKL